MLLMHYKSLGCRTCLPAVLISPSNRELNGKLNICILENDEWVAAAKFENNFL